MKIGSLVQFRYPGNIGTMGPPMLGIVVSEAKPLRNCNQWNVWFSRLGRARPVKEEFLEVVQ